MSVNSRRDIGRPAARYPLLFMKRKHSRGIIFHAPPSRISRVRSTFSTGYGKLSPLPPPLHTRTPRRSEVTAADITLPFLSQGYPLVITILFPASCSLNEFVANTLMQFPLKFVSEWPETGLTLRLDATTSRRRDIVAFPQTFDGEKRGRNYLARISYRAELLTVFLFFSSFFSFFHFD